ncbi:hypothetical protein OGAPHI_006772 [Ogataea philodendri]|uniref:Uncharacterized protein n=1 Tax=Ogataea philodendri TaxID=1378263 RepID=A0A9P8NX40_9ASCO|nr:uncharacterized protein OGAPHI_006772 [Ogataea philodendri]KAH3661365.1 hypothetical protein OGAPHI_006772 [Ogataea philodendri]
MASHEDDKSSGWSRKLHGVPSTHVSSKIGQTINKVIEKDEKTFAVFKTDLKTTLNKYKKTSNERQESQKKIQQSLDKALESSQWLES